jgi:hypothetical protein
MMFFSLDIDRADFRRIGFGRSGTIPIVYSFDRVVVLHATCGLRAMPDSAPASYRPLLGRLITLQVPPARLRVMPMLKKTRCLLFRLF